MVMTYFIDTSALFKRYVQETGTDVLDQIFSGESLLYISALTLVEVMSTLRRFVDVDQLLQEQDFLQAKATILKDVHLGRLIPLEITPDVLTYSLDICSKLYVTPIDALQLATALTLKVNPIFICADKKLLRIAEQLQLKTLNPNDLNNKYDTTGYEMSYLLLVISTGNIE